LFVSGERYKGSPSKCFTIDGAQITLVPTGNKQYYFFADHKKWFIIPIFKREVKRNFNFFSKFSENFIFIVFKCYEKFKLGNSGYLKKCTNEIILSVRQLNSVILRGIRAVWRLEMGHLTGEYSQTKLPFYKSELSD